MALCGIVVTYVSTANNYKLAYEDLRQSYQALEQVNANLLSKTRDQAAGADRVIADKNTRIQALEAKKIELETELAIIKTSEATLQEMINGWASVVQGFKQTIHDMQESLKLVRDELDKTRAQQIDDRQKLNEITSALDVKIFELEAMKAESRRLLEEKDALEKMVQGLSRRTEQPVAPVEPVTVKREKAAPVRGIPGEIELQGSVSEVDLKNSLAGISIGSADGVELGMTFFVSRGDKFICNVLITDVWPEQAAGVLEVVQYPPKVGDHISNHL
jgi:chromosome segregation ATPase